MVCYGIFWSGQLFDIQTGFVLVIKEETRRTEKHSETFEIVALGVRLKLINF